MGCSISLFFFCFFLRPVFDIKIEMNDRSLFGDSTCLLIALFMAYFISWMSAGFYSCWWQLSEWSRCAVGLPCHSPRGSPLAHLAHEVFKCYLRVLIMTGKDCISVQSIFSCVLKQQCCSLSGNPGDFVCCILYRIQRNSTKNNTFILEKEVYFRK